MTEEIKSQAGCRIYGNIGLFDHDLTKCVWIELTETETAVYIEPKRILLSDRLSNRNRLRRLI